MKATFVMGLPGAGKSTYCREKLSGLIINRDGIRTMLYGKYNYIKEDEPMIFEMTIHLAKSAIIGHDKNIIIDETGANVAHRMRWCEVLRNVCKINAIYINTPLETCIKRRIADNKGLDTNWENVIRTMHSGYKKPTLAEGFSKITEIKGW